MTRRAGMIVAVTFSLSVLALMQTGCSKVKPIGPMSEEQTFELQKKLGTIGIVSVHYDPEIEMKTPAKGGMEGFKRGAAEYGRDTVFVAAHSQSSEAAIAGILLSPFVAVAGGVSGAMNAESPSIVREKEATLKKALSELKMQESLREQLAAMTAHSTVYQFKVLENEGPSKKEERPDYVSLKEKGIDTVHEIAVQDVTLEDDGRIDPEFTLYMQSRARLVSTRNNETIITKIFNCESAKHKYTYWTVDDARRFKEEINRCYDEISEEMITSLYINDTIARGGSDRERPSSGRPR